MPSEFVIAILAGLGGMLGWGLSDLIAKKTIDKIGDITTLVLAHFFGAALVILIAVYEVIGKGHALVFPHTTLGWFGVLFFGALQALVYLLVYIGFGKGQVAVLNPIFSSFSGVVALVSVLFLGELISPVLGIGLLVVFLGVMSMNVDLQALKKRKLSFLQIPGFTEIISATVLATIWTLGWSSFVGTADWLTYALLMYLSMTVVLTLYALSRGIKLMAPLAVAWKYLLFIGVLEAGAYIAISWGYGATTATSIVAILSGAFSLPTIIGARLWLKERTTTLQLWGSVCILIGVILVALI